MKALLGKISVKRNILRKVVEMKRNTGKQFGPCSVRVLRPQEMSQGEIIVTDHLAIQTDYSNGLWVWGRWTAGRI